MASKNLANAKNNKNDEFYTQLTDIEKEIGHYKNHFKDKIIFCNCDDPKESNFFRYFALNFKFLGIKKLISTHFERDEPSYKLEIVEDINNDGKINLDDAIKTPLKQNGDFRSPECIEILKESDIIVTNPPFSLFREYIAQLIEYDKNFLIIGNQNAVTYKEVFTLIRENKVWLGYSNGDMEFKVPDYYEERATRFRQDEDGQKWRSLGNICWFTNLDIKKRHEDLILYKTYNENEYPSYDNYEAINVNKVAEIPMDYKKEMGVPITFLSKYNPKQFELISSNDIKTNDKIPFKEHGLIKDKDGTINGKATYVRIVIKHKRM